MKELILDKDLYIKIVEWMQPRYALTTFRERKLFLKKIFKQYKILNKDTLRAMMKSFKHQHQRACISMINSFCQDNDIDFNLVIPRLKAPPKKIPELLSIEEIKLMINSVPKPYDLAIRCIFNFGAGLRISEIIKLRWKDIRWVDWAANPENYGIAQIKSGKGSKDRIVNIPKNLMKDLYQYAKEIGVLNEFNIPSGGLIFSFGAINEKTGKIYKEKLMLLEPEIYKYEYVRSRYNWFRYNIIEKYCEKALGKHIKIHSLRHSRATYLYEIEKVPIEKIQVLLGHSSLNTTLLYTKINPVSVFDLVKDTKEI